MDTKEEVLIHSNSKEKILIHTVGLPRSGKSTWARSTGFPIVNPDSIRLAIHGQIFLASEEPLVWKHVEVMVKSLFLAGHQIVILDTCGNLRRYRDQWKVGHDNRDRKLWDYTYFKVFSTTVDLCIERAKSSQREDLIPIIQKMATYAEPLKPQESEWNGKIKWGTMKENVPL